MAGSEDTRVILEALRADRSTARERQTAMERQIKAEARRLRSGGDARAALPTQSAVCMREMKPSFRLIPHLRLLTAYLHKLQLR